jgi:hypothetical protein
MYHDTLDNPATGSIWNSVQGQELEGFLDQINPIDAKYRVSAATTQVHWRTLPFYETVALIRVRDPNWVNKKLNIYYLTDQGNLFRLNGTSPPIHEVNAKAPVKINESNVLEYLRFFCFFVRGEEGPFYIAESITDPNMPKDMDDATRSTIEGIVRPATFDGINEQGHFLCEAVVFYSNALFTATFGIQPTGMIEMMDDQPIVADLPTRVDCPVS